MPPLVSRERRPSPACKHIRRRAPLRPRDWPSMAASGLSSGRGRRQRLLIKRLPDRRPYTKARTSYQVPSRRVPEPCLLLRLSRRRLTLRDKTPTRAARVARSTMPMQTLLLPSRSACWNRTFSAWAPRRRRLPIQVSTRTVLLRMRGRSNDLSKALLGRPLQRRHRSRDPKPVRLLRRLRRQLRQQHHRPRLHCCLPNQRQSPPRQERA